MKTFRIFIFAFVGAFGHGITADGADRLLARDVTSNMPFSVTGGTVSVVEFQSGILPPNGVMFYTPKKERVVGALPVVLTESIAGINRFIRAEFPSGVNQDFVLRILPGLLGTNFSFTGGVSYQTQAKVEEVREAMMWAKKIRMVS